MKDFFTFRTMFTPILAKILYVLGAIGIIIFTIMAIAKGSSGINPFINQAESGYETDYDSEYNTGDSTENSANAGSVIVLLITFVVAEIAWRVMCEGVIVIFSIHEELVRANGGPAKKRK